MKKAIFVLLSLALLLAVCLAAPLPAAAANEDFEVEFAFRPDASGYLGGDIPLRLDVTNTGPTPITWVDVVVNNESAFSDRWEGSIAPGATQRIWFTVPFSAFDMNRSRFLQVSMNNNITTNPDGVKMFPFEMGTTDIYGITTEISPDRGVYRVGDTVTITYVFFNRFEGGPLENARYQISLDHEAPRRIYDSGMNIYGTLEPPDEVTHSFSYTFRSGDIGEVAVVHGFHFDLLGRMYHVVEPSMFLTVEAALPPEVIFTAVLSADKTQVDAGEMVTLSIDIENTGDDAIDSVEVISADGETVSTFDSVSPEVHTQAVTSARYNETTDVYFTVVGRTDEVETTVDTNTVRIEVIEPAETPAPTQSEQAALQTGQPSPEITMDGDNEGADEAQKTGNRTTLYIIIVVLGVLILAGAVAIIVMLRKKKNKPDKSRHPDNTV